MKYVPRVVYNGGVTTFDFTLAMELWEYEEGARLGDEDVSAAGIPESYWVGWDQAVNLTLRFTDAERPNVLNWLLWAMQNKSTAFDFRFDKTDAATLYTVYLESPKTGERVKPVRDKMQTVWTVKVTLRSVNGTRFDVQLPT